MTNDKIEKLKSACLRFDVSENIRVTIHYVGFDEDEKDGSVTCNVSACMVYPVDVFFRPIGSRRLKRETKDNVLTYKATGKAKCHDEDKFDLRKGRKIAQARAFASLYNKISEDVLVMGQSYERVSQKCFFNYFRYKVLSEGEKINLENLIEKDA
jgi:hypothetical protein